MTAKRTRLPNRRPSETRTLTVGNHTFAATVGFDPATGRPQEIFLDGAKAGSNMAAILGDASVVISVALQHGVPAAALAKSVSRAPAMPSGLARPIDTLGPEPASVIGGVLDLLQGFEANV